MGQFIDQVQKANAIQEQQLTEKKRKQLEKDKKEILKHQLSYIENSIFENIDNDFKEHQNEIDEAFIRLSNNEDIILDDYYKYIFDLKNEFSFKITDFETNQLCTLTKQFYRKALNQIYNNYKKSKKIKEQSQEEARGNWQIAIIEAFKILYGKYKLEAYFKINQAKPKILQIIGQQNNLKAYEFIDKYNKKFFEEEKKKIKPKGLSIGNILFALCGGVYLGYKADKKKTNKKIKW